MQRKISLGFGVIFIGIVSYFLSSAFSFPITKGNDTWFVLEFMDSTYTQMMYIPHGPLIMVGFKWLYQLTGSVLGTLRGFPLLNGMVFLGVFFIWVQKEIGRREAMFGVVLMLGSYTLPVN